MESMKKFSFIIPSYQSKRLLRNTLEALNYQTGYTRDDYEVIVIDDGSTDDTLSYIKEVNKNYELKYIYIPRLDKSCRSRARNRGWREVEGKIAIFIDADIIVGNDYLYELDRYYAMCEQLVVIGTRLNLPEHGTFENINNIKKWQNKAYTQNEVSLLEMRHLAFERLSYNMANCRYPWLMVFGCNIVVPLKLVEKVEGFDENFIGWGIEDIEFGYRLYKEGAKIVVNSKLEVLHQFHRVDSASEQDRIKEIEYNTSYFLHKHPDAFDEPKDEVFDFFKGKTLIALDFKQGKPLRQEIIEFTQGERLEDLKGKIIELSSSEGLDIIIRDYVGTTNMDVWLQLLGQRPSTPKYWLSRLSGGRFS